jgi:hypothetical protein
LNHTQHEICRRFLDLGIGTACLELKARRKPVKEARAKALEAEAVPSTGSKRETHGMKGAGRRAGPGFSSCHLGEPWTHREAESRESILRVVNLPLGVETFCGDGYRGIDRR